jgi:hypothetical protein
LSQQGFQADVRAARVMRAVRWKIPARRKSRIRFSRSPLNWSINSPLVYSAKGKRDLAGDSHSHRPAACAGRRGRRRARLKGKRVCRDVGPRPTRPTGGASAWRKGRTQGVREVGKGVSGSARPRGPGQIKGVFLSNQRLEPTDWNGHSVAQGGSSEPGGWRRLKRALGGTLPKFGKSHTR